MGITPGLGTPGPGASVTRHVLSQRLVIMPCGNISGGQLHYTLAAEIGLIHYQGEVHVRRWFRRRTHRFSGELRINPVVLHSAHVRVGQTVYHRRVKIRVKHIGDGQAECDVYYDGAYPGEGLAVFDLTQPYVSLKSVAGDGTLRHRSVLGNKHLCLQVLERTDGHQNI